MKRKGVILFEILISMAIFFLIAITVIKILSQSRIQASQRIWHAEASSTAANIIARVVSKEVTILVLQSELANNLTFNISLKSKPSRHKGLVEIRVQVKPLEGQFNSISPVELIELIPLTNLNYTFENRFNLRMLDED